MSEIFLRKSLLGWDLSKGGKATGEQRGGSYVARVQTGYEKDGSPKYRYFKTEQEYQAYLEGDRGKKERSDQKKKGKDLKDKTKSEKKKQKKKQSQLFTKQAKKDKKDKKSSDDKAGDKKVKKSLPVIFLAGDL